MKASEIIKILKEQNWYLIEHGKKHDKWGHELSARIILVPRHKSQELSKGVEKDIISKMEEVKK